MEEEYPGEPTSKKRGRTATAGTKSKNQITVGNLKRKK